MPNIRNILLLIATIIILSSSYTQLNTHNAIMLYYQQHSYLPILHVYYNRHFSKSKQFQAFLETIEQVEFEVGTYARILLTDCQYEKSDHSIPCKQIKRLNQNRMILGYQPTTQFTSFGDKLMQSPPQNKIFDHFSDHYQVQQFVRFINQLVPNFMKEIHNTNQFEVFKQPRYVPKMVYAAQEGDVPLVMRQLSVQFFLRFDMSHIDDLTQSVVGMLEITHFPSLMILKHNFQTQKLQIFHYEKHDFAENQRDQIRKFLQAHALKQRRNDRVFHLIEMEKSAQIESVENSAELDEYLDRVQSWVFLEEGRSFDKLTELKTNYGRFYNYVHMHKPQVEKSKLYLVNQRSGIKFDYEEQKVGYRLVNAEELHSNMTIWLKKDYVVMAVRQEYGYLCTIVDKPLFAGLVQCFIIQDDSYDEVADRINIKFTYGFILSAKNSPNDYQSTSVKGNDIATLNYEEIYRNLQYTTRMKVKDIIDQFIEHPVKNVPSVDTTTVQELCAQPFKKCILYFYESSSSDMTKYQYLQLEAKDFVNEYKFYAVDLRCNKHLYEEIPQLKDAHGGLVAYHPRLEKFVYLKAKMTRNVIRKFLQINNQDKKSLPFKTFTTRQTVLNACRQEPQQAQSNDKTFAQQL